MLYKENDEEVFNPEEFEEPEFPPRPPPSPEEEFRGGFEGETETYEIPSPSKEMIAAKQKLEKRFLEIIDQKLPVKIDTEVCGLENISGIGISEKTIDGKPTGELAVTVYVVEKKPKDMIEKTALVPEEINRIPTDVKAIGEIEIGLYDGRFPRPVKGGISIGHFWGGTGTLGCLVYRGRRLYILSNNHVIARSNWATRGAPIIQPSRQDGYAGVVRAKDYIAVLYDWVPLKFDGTLNKVDAAIAKTSLKLVSPEIMEIGSISSEIASCKLLYMPVMKCGRSSQLTTGKIIDANFTTIKPIPNYGPFGCRAARFKNQILIESDNKDKPFALKGDSGSLVVTQEDKPRAVGLYFASTKFPINLHKEVTKDNKIVSLANPIQDVLKGFNVKIYSNDSFENRTR